MQSMAHVTTAITQGPHSQILMTGGGGGSDRGSYFIPKKNHNFKICLPKKITTFFRNPKKSLCYFSRPKKIPVPFIDPKKSLGPPPPPSLKYVSGAPGRYNFPYKVLYLQLVVSSITIHSLLAWANCDTRRGRTTLGDALIPSRRGYVFLA